MIRDWPRVRGGIFLHPSGVNTPYFFTYIPDQLELITPVGVKSWTDAEPSQHGAFKKCLTVQAYFGIQSWPVVTAVHSTITINTKQDRASPEILWLVYSAYGILNPGLVFTALHGMQTRYSVWNSVCPSVRPSNAWIVTKRKKAVFRFLYHTKEHLS